MSDDIKDILRDRRVLLGRCLEVAEALDRAGIAPESVARLRLDLPSGVSHREVMDASGHQQTSAREEEIDERAMRITELVAAESLRGVSAGASSYRLATGIVQAAIAERDAQRAKREGDGVL